MIRIFIGAPANNEDLESQAVLDWTLHKHASEPLEITFMKLSRHPLSFWYSDFDATPFSRYSDFEYGIPPSRRGWNTTGWATPFSPFRWAIPEFCNFEGRAIYLDVDMMVMDDIAKLWNIPFNSGVMAIAKGPKTFCCSLFDCARAKHFLPPVSELRSKVGKYRDVRKSFGATTVQSFAPWGNWNCLDGEQYASLRDPDIKIIHCTSIPTQPQLKYALPRLERAGQKHWFPHETRPHWRPDIQPLFDELLTEAKANGYHPENYQTAEIFGDYGR